MALFDWNRNGKDDMFDRFMDYQLYMETFGKEEEEETENEDYLFDDDELYDDSSDDDFSYSPTSVIRQHASAPSDQQDLWGMREIERKSTDEILKILIKRKSQMQSVLKFCSRESGFTQEVMDNSQMLLDFWLYELNWALEQSSFTRTQRIQVLALLMKAFQIENPTGAEEHYKNMDSNNDYYKYIQYCFGYQGSYHSLFWIILATMSGNNGERLEMTTGVTKNLVRFHKQLNRYLANRFPGYGFDCDLQTKLIHRMDKTTEKLDQTADVSSAAKYLFNPLYTNI